MTATEISLAACGRALGNVGAGGETISNIATITNKFAELSGKTLKGEMTPLRAVYIETVAPFLIENAHLLRGGKTLPERMLLSGFEHDNILFTALNAYSRAYPDNFERLGMQVLANQNLPVTMRNRAVKQLCMSGSYDDKLAGILARILAGYSPEMKTHDKHMVTLAAFYLGLLGKIHEGKLITIIDNELNELVSHKDDGAAPPDTATFYETVMPPKSNLLPIAIEVLGLAKSDKAKQ